MSKWEEKLRDWIMRHVLWLAWAAVMALGVFLRWSYLPNLAADLEFMNAGWYNAIREGGVKAALAPELQYTYSPLHLYLWRLESLLLPGVSTYTALKLCSLLFEALNLIVVYALLRTVLPKEKREWGCFLGCALVWLSPVMLWNVAGWGQTDIFYTLFALLAVLLLLKDQPQWGLVCLGVSLAWKLQAVFLLPLFLIAYFAGRKRFSLFWFLAVPGVLLLSSLPMALIGESPLFAVQIYLGQTGMYSEITYNCPNLYAILGDALQQKQATLGLFSRTGLCLCIAALGVAAVWILRSRREVSGQDAVLLGAWCVLCCVFFLPRMHERYAIVGELLLLIWAVCRNRPENWCCVVLNALATLSAYSEYMFRRPFFPLQLGGVMNLAVLLYLSFVLLQRPMTSEKEPAL